MVHDFSSSPRRRWSISNNLRIVTKAEAKRLVKDGAGAVVGVEFVKDGLLRSEYGPVIIATGGFGADYQVRPDGAFPNQAAHCFTSNAPVTVRTDYGDCLTRPSSNTRPTRD